MQPHKQPRAAIEHRSRFAPTTKGIRLRPDQIEWVHKEIMADPEQSWSRLVREGLDLVKKHRLGLIQVLTPAK